MGEAVNVTRDWSNEPANYGTPEFYANEARKLARQHGLSCKVMTEADAAREKMGLFLGVGQGSDREGRIVVLEYKPKGVKNPKTLALVGKGVTFDSGGISLKPGLRMEEMKHDMTGAATRIAAKYVHSAARPDGLTDLRTNIVQGEFNLRGNGLLVGRELAANLGLRVGDHVEITSPALARKMREVMRRSEGQELKEVTKPDEYTVRGVFDVGYYEFNANFVLTSLANGQDLFELADNVHALQVMLHNQIGRAHV